jgi:DNA modification methylase
VIVQGDCLEVMAGMDPESFDAIITDPPYGLEFMGKSWDQFRVDDPTKRRHGGKRPGNQGEIKPTDNGPFGRVGLGGGDRPTTSRCVGCGKRDQFRKAHGCPDGTDWRTEVIDPYTAPPSSLAFGEWCRAWGLQAYRVARPGAYLLAFGGTRTYHRLAAGLEDAGWIIRDTLVWGYASGFPKSKATLKPAWEPIVMARKPGPLRNLAIDATRIPWASDADRESQAALEGYKASVDQPGMIYGGGQGIPKSAELIDRGMAGNDVGRWPANIVLTDPIFDGDTPGVVGGGMTTPAAKGMQTYRRADHDGATMKPGNVGNEWQAMGYGDAGTYSRFFLIPKADRGDREPVLGGHGLTGELRTMNDGANGHDPARPIQRANTHPTVKPTDLMRHLVRLVTPTGGRILDPFLGSGTTGLAAELEGFDWVGIEREAEYIAIAEARLNGTQRGLGLEAS